MAEGLQGTLVAPDRCVHHVDGEQDLLQLQDTYGFGKDVLGNLKQMLRKTPMAAGRDRRRKAGGADAPWQLLEDAAFLREQHTGMFVGLVGSNAHRLKNLTPGKLKNDSDWSENGEIVVKHQMQSEYWSIKHYSLLISMTCFLVSSIWKERASPLEAGAEGARRGPKRRPTRLSKTKTTGRRPAWHARPHRPVPRRQPCA